MRRWFADGLFRAVIRNAGYLGSTKLIGALLGLLALASAGRALDPAVFGVLMVVHTYATGVGALVKFQSWQVILRYGAPALGSGDDRPARDAIRFAFGLDILSGAVGMAAAMAALPLLAGWFGVERAYFPLALFYCTLVPTMSAATATGVLRLLDRFDLIAAQQLVTPVLRAIGAGIAWAGQLGFPGFVVAWYVGDLAGDLALWGLAARELRRHDMLDAFRPGLRGVARRLPGSWGLVWTTNLSTSVNAAWGPISNLIVAGILGPIAAGLYKIASTLLDSAGKPADLLTKGFFPEIMRLDPASKRPWRLALRTGLFSGLIGAVVVAAILLGGKPLILAAFGHKYAAASGLLSLMAVALMVSMAGFPLESLLYMVGRQGTALAAQIAATTVYVAGLAALSIEFGLTGAGVAYVIGALCRVGFMVAPVLSDYRTRRRFAHAS